MIYRPVAENYKTCYSTIFLYPYLSMGWSRLGTRVRHGLIQAYAVEGILIELRVERTLVILQVQKALKRSSFDVNFSYFFQNRIKTILIFYVEVNSKNTFYLKKIK